MADMRYTDECGIIHRAREIRRGEHAMEIAIADSSIPGSGLFFSTDNEMMIAPRTSVLSIDTEGPTVPTSWVQSHVGSGSATQSDGELFLSTGATPNSRSRVTSTRVARRRAGATQWYISVWRIPTLPSAGTVMRWGMYDDDNGFFFQLDENGLQAGVRKNGVDTLVAGDGMNGPLLVSDLDLTKMNQFNLFYGGLSCRWQVNGRVIHAIGAGVPTEALTASINLSLRAEVLNSGGSAADVDLVGRGVSFHRVSPNGIVPEYRNLVGAGTTTIVQGAGTLHRVIVATPTAAAVITLYDNIAGSGNVIAIITIPASANNPFVLEFGVEFNLGLTVVKTGTSNVTVVYD